MLVGWRWRRQRRGVGVSWTWRPYITVQINWSYCMIGGTYSVPDSRLLVTRRRGNKWKHNKWKNNRNRRRNGATLNSSSSLATHQPTSGAAIILGFKWPYCKNLESSARTLTDCVLDVEVSRYWCEEHLYLSAHASNIIIVDKISQTNADKGLPTAHCTVQQASASFTVSRARPGEFDVSSLESTPIGRGGRCFWPAVAFWPPELSLQFRKRVLEPKYFQHFTASFITAIYY